MTTTRRKKILDITREEIKEAAREMMLEKGTAGLSIRAIARKMEMTAPALYHYYKNLDELTTALIVDGFSNLADTLAQAAADPAHQTAGERLYAVGNANRNWALTHPVDFQLLYGNPIPGYEQPLDITYPPARRSFLITANIFVEALKTSELDHYQANIRLSDKLQHSLEQLTAVDGHRLPQLALYLAAVAWTRLHGHIMLELFNLIQPVIGDVDAFFDQELRKFIHEIGLN
ncbi:MAG: TetR/AcrR family transcriptional regulator [Chloroflexota bacterium]